MKTYAIIIALLCCVICVLCYQLLSGNKPCQPAKMDAISAIMTRTSVRAFTSDLVSDQLVDTLLRAGLAAPTARNLQPWHLVAVSRRETLDALADANPHGGMLRNAPLAIVVCGDMNKAMEGDGHDFWIQDCSAVTENILLAAHASGLGAVWTGAYPIQERCQSIAQVLELPENLIPLATIVIGYPAENPQPKDKYKTENITLIQ
ncbi:MAG: nitroreductase family protein [Paludibacteraceae bacterium]|nr:nitroreductase family protein [Paludibacteraceae bacterium]